MNYDKVVRGNFFLSNRVKLVEFRFKLINENILNSELHSKLRTLKLFKNCIYQHFSGKAQNLD